MAIASTRSCRFYSPVRARSPSFRGARHPCDVSRSCYLARYNQITDAPRKLIEATGAELVELRVTAQTPSAAAAARIWKSESEIDEIRASNAFVRRRPARNRRLRSLLPGGPDDVHRGGGDGRGVLVEVVELTELVERAVA